MITVCQLTPSCIVKESLFVAFVNISVLQESQLVDVFLFRDPKVTDCAGPFNDVSGSANLFVHGIHGRVIQHLPPSASMFTTKRNWPAFTPSHRAQYPVKTYPLEEARQNKASSCPSRRTTSIALA